MNEQSMLWRTTITAAAAMLFWGAAYFIRTVAWHGSRESKWLIALLIPIILLAVAMTILTIGIVAKPLYGRWYRRVSWLAPSTDVIPGTKPKPMQNKPVRKEDRLLRPGEFPRPFQ